MEDESRPGRPVTACGDANVSKVVTSLNDDRGKTCEEIGNETSVSRTSAVTDVLAGYERELLEHPPYSLDLAPFDFSLFPKMKEHFRGHRFQSEEDIIQATKETIKWLDKSTCVSLVNGWLQRM
ncbi:uncharacterized protein LOC106011361 [Aplysia californica]|uniref:Uncharacterized protein LOC106011361 n=1 Tax=Aplysia californica TaxID=6500 RepID=A0ABM0ZWU8_APLCA|nr:uncharacterized protein LOC106011361 [Aplysia californica]